MVIGAPFIRRIVFSVMTMLFVFGVTPQAQAQQQRNTEGTLQAFMITATYGVISGSLVGVASLAFYDNPGKKTRNIALGASLGLYAGILLGAYVVYFPTLESSWSQPDEDDRGGGGFLDSDPIRLDSGSLSPRKNNTGEGWLPLVSWSPDQGTVLGVAYNF